MPAGGYSVERVMLTALTDLAAAEGVAVPTLCSAKTVRISKTKSTNVPIILFIHIVV